MATAMEIEQLFRDAMRDLGEGLTVSSIVDDQMEGIFVILDFVENGIKIRAGIPILFSVMKTWALDDHTRFVAAGLSSKLRELMDDEKRRLAAEWMRKAETN